MSIPLEQMQPPLQAQERLKAQAKNRRSNDRAIIENPLSHLTDQELEDDVTRWVHNFLPIVDPEQLLRGARVAKDIRVYDEVARCPDAAYGADLQVLLTAEERKALRREKDVTFSEKGMYIVIFTVSLASFLQGFVQSSFNGATLYKCHFGLGSCTHPEDGNTDWRLGAVNAAPYLFAAVLGCPLSLPINYWFGRRGGMAFAALCIFISSIAACFVHSWEAMFCVRMINGLGMGVKAVSTTILASETAVGFWRGSAILAWQLWVAFGIMMGFAFNLIFSTASTTRTRFELISGAPLVPAFALFIVVVFFCPESPRYHLLKGPNYSPERAYKILRKLRNTELQALRDMYTVHKSIEQEYMGGHEINPYVNQYPGFRWAMRDFFVQFKELFQRRRLYNAVISTSVVNLAQQLCGVNVLAFYSGFLFNRTGSSNEMSMAYSLGFGAINFAFALPAVKSIDVLGRRKWLIMTLPFMAICMTGAATSFSISDDSSRKGAVTFFLFLFAVFYSPGMGPIPFTLASESFPLSHREAGTAWAISINLLFAGLLAIFYPRIDSAMHHGGALGLFAGLNVIALILVFLLVEETKRRSLEDLDLIFAVSKRRFMRFQLRQYLPWFINHYFLSSWDAKPQFYHDVIWGTATEKPSTSFDSDRRTAVQAMSAARLPPQRRISLESVDSRHA